MVKNYETSDIPRQALCSKLPYFVQNTGTQIYPNLNKIPSFPNILSSKKRLYLKLKPGVHQLGGLRHLNLSVFLSSKIKKVCVGSGGGGWWW